MTSLSTSTTTAPTRGEPSPEHERHHVVPQEQQPMILVPSPRDSSSGSGASGADSAPIRHERAGPLSYRPLARFLHGAGARANTSGNRSFHNNAPPPPLLSIPNLVARATSPVLSARRSRLASLGRARSLGSAAGAGAGAAASTTTCPPLLSSSSSLPSPTSAGTHNNNNNKKQLAMSEADAQAQTKSALSQNDAMVYLDGPQVYACQHCRTHLTSHDDIISKSFHGRHGRAYLFNQAVNVRIGPPEDRMLMTGLHAVCDINCIRCNTLIGWTYQKAYEHSQKYKEGKYIIEKVHLYLEESDYFDVPAPAGERCDRWRKRSISWGSQTDNTTSIRAINYDPNDTNTAMVYEYPDQGTTASPMSTRTLRTVL